MTQIGIPFNKWSLERLLNGSKSATSRNKKYGKVGDVFIIRGKIFKLTNIEKKKLIIIAMSYYPQEGAETSDEFIGIWRKIHPRAGWTPNKRVWFHQFAEVDKL